MDVNPLSSCLPAFFAAPEADGDHDKESSSCLGRIAEIFKSALA